MARDAKFQALMPIRGKNTLKSDRREFKKRYYYGSDESHRYGIQMKTKRQPSGTFNIDPVALWRISQPMPTLTAIISAQWFNHVLFFGSDLLKGYVYMRSLPL